VRLAKRVTEIDELIAAICLTAWSHHGRVRSEAAFAALAGVNPIPASSGNTVRHRLNRGGDRRMNRALHIAALTPMTHDPATPRLPRRRRSEGRTTKGIRRCLKRYLARHIYRLLKRRRHHPRPGVTNIEESFASGTRRRRLARRYRCFMITGLDHVQVAIPVGGESTAREYYGVILGMEEIPKPTALVQRGGCWFTSGRAVLHLGVEEPFTPAKKAHPAFLVTDLDALAAALEQGGASVTRSDGDLPGIRRFHTFDPFGNRLEFQQV
jgi:predicted enzyme related to lactoylglutathione lyase